MNFIHSAIKLSLYGKRRYSMDLHMTDSYDKYEFASKVNAKL
jgi:hypothetical protein